MRGKRVRAGTKVSRRGGRSGGCAPPGPRQGISSPGPRPADACWSGERRCFRLSGRGYGIMEGLHARVKRGRAPSEKALRAFSGGSPRFTPRMLRIGAAAAGRRGRKPRCGRRSFPISCGKLPDRRVGREPRSAGSGEASLPGGVRGKAPHLRTAQCKRPGVFAGPCFCGCFFRDQTAPWAIMALATFRKPAMLAPTT